jgi:Uma2 family endonuclease
MMAQPYSDLTLTRHPPRVDIVRMAGRLLPGPFTVDAYHRLTELGIFDEDDRVELLDGQIVEMTPIGGRHAACVVRLNNLLARRSADTAVSMQNPVVLGERWEPQPDIAVLRRAAGLAGAWLPSPADVVLVIEVADTSLQRDRDVKIPRYAESGIPEAWLVDLDGDTITVYRTPGPEGYSEIVTVSRRDTLRPLMLDGVAIAADEVLG